MERRSNRPLLVPVEEVKAKFESKLDMYTVMSVDMNYFFPQYDKCPVAFLRSILSGEKKAIKDDKAINVCVPKYKELSTRAIWDFGKEVPDLMVYFPEYTSNQCSDKDYLFTILGVLRGEDLKTLIQEARRKRSIYEESDINELVEVAEEIKRKSRIYSHRRVRLEL